MLHDPNYCSILVKVKLEIEETSVPGVLRGKMEGWNSGMGDFLGQWNYSACTVMVKSCSYTFVKINRPHGMKSKNTCKAVTFLL